MIDPIADRDETDAKPLASRVETLDGIKIGLFSNGKQAAEPTLQVTKERLEAAHPDAKFRWYQVDHLNKLKRNKELATITEWASDLDACVGSMGDCGSCTKFLAYGVNAVEEAGTPAVGLIDSGFELDWKSNSADLGRPLRFQKLPRVAEVTDHERLLDVITESVANDIEEELTRPLMESEKSELAGATNAAIEATAETED